MMDLVYMNMMLLGSIIGILALMFFAVDTNYRIKKWREATTERKDMRLRERRQQRQLDLCDEASYMGLLVTQVEGYEETARKLWPVMYFDLW